MKTSSVSSAATTRDTTGEITRLAEQTVELARAAGAHGAEVLVRDGLELSIKVRLGEVERLQEAGSRGLGLRVFVDGRAASVSTSDLRPEALERLVREGVQLAALSEPDPDHRLPDADELARGPFDSTLQQLDLWSDGVAQLDAATALDWARRGERAAQQADARVTNSDGATFSRVVGASAFANSGGFLGGYRGSYASLTVEPICDDADGKKRNGYWWTGARHREDLESPEAVGREAAARTVRKLGPTKVATCEAPVVFDPEAARDLVRLIVSVANGSAFYRRSTYLLERENTLIASPLVNVVDDPFIPRGPGSRPYDGDGLPSRRNVVVEAGVLTTVLCDTYTARKLGRRSTGSAGRGGAEPGPSPSNLVLQAGTSRPEEILQGVQRGLYVTEMMGFGFNPVTGDFSRGAAGFWIENGELTFPVSEVTVSANLDDLLKRIDAVGTDLDLRTSTASPTLRVSRMAIGGK
jgi:PmbA protein